MSNTVIGKVHSFQSLGAVDGPGLRFVVFMQGCPYTCPYCHNPDTKSYSGGEEYTVENVVKKALRFRPYFGEKGGVTLSGGEPLIQAEFAAQLFEALHKQGINTALDTAGAYPTQAVKAVLKHTDIVLCDIKFPTDEQYKKYIGTTLETTLAFIEACNQADTDIIIRHVVVPGLTDSVESVKAVAELARKAKKLKKIELLPFHKMCTEKYERLGLEFPLESTPECDTATIEKLKQYI